MPYGADVSSLVCEINASIVSCRATLYLAAGCFFSACLVLRSLGSFLACRGTLHLALVHPAPWLRVFDLLYRGTLYRRPGAITQWRLISLSWRSSMASCR